MFVEVIRSLTSDEKEDLIHLWARDAPQTGPGLTSFSEGRVAELRNGGGVLSVLTQLETLTDTETAGRILKLAANRPFRAAGFMAETPRDPCERSARRYRARK